MNDKVHPAPDIEPPRPNPAPLDSFMYTPSPQSQFGNLAMQSLLYDPAANAQCRAPMDWVQPEPPPRDPIKIDIDLFKPGTAYIPDDVDLGDVSRDLYGIDLSAYFEIDEGAWGMGTGTGRVRLRLFVELLKEPYQSQFHDEIEQELPKDVGYVKSKLLETWVDDDDEDAILKHVRWWSKLSDIRDRNGVTYFDRFLGWLHSDTWYTDYLVKSGSSRTYLSLLYDEIEDDIGELTSLIANHSERFGSYHPTSLAPRAEAPDDQSQLFVKRVTDQLLDRMVGITLGSDEQGIVNMMTGLPAIMQVRVLQDLQTRHSERRLGIFSRTGEQDDVGMMFFLFEDLDEDDSKRMGADLVAKGVLTQEAVDFLVARRTWAGRNLPWSTGHGARAAQFWANEFNDSDNAAYSAFSATMGSFASLWTPDTAVSTVLALSLPGSMGLMQKGVALLPRTFQLGIGAVGAGYTSYTVTKSGIAMVTGYADGRELHPAERVAKGLEILSTVLLTGVSFAGGRSPRIQVNVPKPALLPGRVAPMLGSGAGRGALPPAGGTQPRVRWRVLNETADEVTAVGISDQTDDFAIMTINKRTGDGSVFSPTLGHANLRNGQLIPVQPQTALPGAMGAADDGMSLLAPRAPVPGSPMLPATKPTVQLHLPGDVGPPQLQLPGPVGAPIPLTTPPSPLMLGQGQPSEWDDFTMALTRHVDAEFGPGGGQLTWSVLPDGTAFATPPVPRLPIYTPQGPTVPGDFYRNTPLSPTVRTQSLVGPLKPGFSPFDVFAPPAPTPLTLNQVRGMRGGNTVRGNTGRDHVRALHGGDTEVTLTLPMGVSRRSDLLSPVTGGTLNQEAKTYLRYLTRNGVTQVREVQPSQFLTTEISRDAAIMYYYPGQQPLWVFVDAPPSAALAAELAAARIPYMVYTDRLPLMFP